MLIIYLIVVNIFQQLSLNNLNRKNLNTLNRKSNLILEILCCTCYTWKVSYEMGGVGLPILQATPKLSEMRN